MPRTIGMHVFDILYRYVMFTYKILLMLGIPIIQSLKKLNKIFDIPPLPQKKPTNDKPRNSHPEWTCMRGTTNLDHLELVVVVVVEIIY